MKTTDFIVKRNKKVQESTQVEPPVAKEPQFPKFDLQLAESQFQKGVAEVSNDTLKSYQQKVSADSQKHKMDPTKRSPEKANRSVAGFAKASNRLEKGVAEGSREDKIAKHNAAVAKMTKRGFAKLDYNHPDLLKSAPKGYNFGVTHKLVPKQQGVAEGYDQFNRMMNKITKPDALNTREALALMDELIYQGGASYREALDQASVSYEIDPAKLHALYQQHIKGIAEAKSLSKKVRVAKGEHAGKIGWIREIHRNGPFKDAPKSYFVDLEDGTQLNNVPGTALRLVKEDASAGATGSSSVAAVVGGLGETNGRAKLIKRQGKMSNVLQKPTTIKVKGGY